MTVLDSTSHPAEYTILFCDDEAAERTRFLENHRGSGFDIDVCADIEEVPHLLMGYTKLPDLVVLDLYHSRYSPDSRDATRAGEKTKPAEERLAEILVEVKKNADQYYQPRAIRILSELRNNPALGNIPVLLYTRQGMLAITDEELHEASHYGAEWMLKGRKPETERKRMRDIILRTRAAPHEGKKVIFLSHAWEDRAIVQVFKDALFAASTSKSPRHLNAAEYEWFYTSDPQDPSVEPGEVIWRTIEDRLIRCEYFVVFWSPSYFKSQTCQNELGAIKALSARVNPLHPLRMIPIKLAPFDEKYFNHIINRSVRYLEAYSSDGVQALFKALAPAFSTTSKRRNRIYAKVADKAKSARIRQRTSRPHRIVTLWRKHLLDTSYPNSPVTFFVESAQYRKIALDLSKEGAHTLIWTVNRSPLRTPEAYGKPETYLSSPDVDFEKLKSVNKHRLVIFEDWQEARCYIHPPSSFVLPSGTTVAQRQLERRREEFEKSVLEHGGQLSFTTKLRACNIIKEARLPVAGIDYWDFGFAKTEDDDNAEFLFVSGFESASFRTVNAKVLPADFRHLVLYSKPHVDGYEVLRSIPAYELLYGAVRCLFDVVDGLLAPNMPSGIFVDTDNIASLEDPT